MFLIYLCAQHRMFFSEILKIRPSRSQQNLIYIADKIVSFSFWRLTNKVARFFLVQQTKTGKYTQMAINIPKDNGMHQKYSSQDLQNIPKLVFFGKKIYVYHLATLLTKRTSSISRKVWLAGKAIRNGLLTNTRNQSRPFYFPW
jgi:hypothetical protein